MTNSTCFFTVQAMVPLRSLEEEPDMETSNESTALQIEHDTLQEVIQYLISMSDSMRKTPPPTTPQKNTSTMCNTK